MLVLHRLALHAPRPKRVLVLERAAATSEQHAQPGHLGEGDHAGGVAGVQDLGTDFTVAEELHRRTATPGDPLNPGATFEIQPNNHS